MYYSELCDAFNLFQTLNPPLQTFYGSDDIIVGKVIKLDLC